MLDNVWRQGPLVRRPGTSRMTGKLVCRSLMPPEPLRENLSDACFSRVRRTTYQYDTDVLRYVHLAILFNRVDGGEDRGEPGAVQLLQTTFQGTQVPCAAPL